MDKIILKEIIKFMEEPEGVIPISEDYYKEMFYYLGSRLKRLEEQIKEMKEKAGIKLDILMGYTAGKRKGIIWACDEILGKELP